MKKVCMILNNNFAHDSRVLREAKSLQAANYEVVVLAVEDQSLPSTEAKEGITVKRALSRLPIVWLSLRAKKRHSVNRAIAAAVTEVVDIYHCHDLDTLMVGYQAAQVRGAKLVYDSHEYWPDSTRGISLPPQTLKKRVGKKVLDWTERRLIKKTNAIVTVNESIAELLSQRYGIARPVVVANCMPYQEVRRSQLLPELLGAGEKKVALYLGGLYPYRGLKNLVESAKYLSQVVIAIVGYGPLKEELNKQVKVELLEGKVRLLPPVSFDKILECAASADIGVSPIENISLSYYYALPNKIFEYLMAGLPIAVSNFPEMARIVDKYQVGAKFDPSNPKDIARAIDEILSDEERYQKMRENAKKIVKEVYNWENEEKKLLEVYQKLFGES